MAVTSIRFNEKEEKLLDYLKKTFHCDASSLIKRSLRELYEDLKEKEIIEDFEKKEKSKKTKFLRIEDILE